MAVSKDPFVMGGIGIQDDNGFVGLQSEETNLDTAILFVKKLYSGSCFYLLLGKINA